MKRTNILLLLVFLCTYVIAQDNLKNKRIQITLATSFQNIIDNFDDEEREAFGVGNYNIDRQFKIGWSSFKGRLNTGLAFDYWKTNNIRVFPDETTYSSSKRLNLGIYAKYYPLNYFFAEAYVGLVSRDSNLLHPNSNIEAILTYRLDVGYSVFLFHFLSIDPRIGIANRRNSILQQESRPKDIGNVSIGLGLVFHL